MEAQDILKVQDLHVHFHTFAGTVQAVRGISFGLRKGETLALVGESGSGKSVAVKTITGLLPGNAEVLGGSIQYGSQDLLKLSESQMCQVRGSKIGFVFQDPLSALDPIMKVGKQIAETMRLKLGMSRARAKERALELMRSVDIPDPERRYDEYPFQLSGGMRQRIVIAIALSCRPEILICDEPTTALDVSVQSQILELIGQMQEENHLSVIFITHDLGVVASVADRVAVMYAGKIVEIGTLQDIFYDPRHPYTWSLLSSMPTLKSSSQDKLTVIPGTPPNMLKPPEGDAFAPRNRYAMRIDFEREPPMFKVSDTHYAAAWLLHPSVPQETLAQMEKMRRCERGES